MGKIDQAISTLEWENDKGIDSANERTIALLKAISVLVFHLERIADALASLNEKH